ncbi:MAG: transglycosylase SLT domain-containing protein [Polyangiaceae bacterium]
MAGRQRTNAGTWLLGTALALVAGSACSDRAPLPGSAACAPPNCPAAPGQAQPPAPAAPPAVQGETFDPARVVPVLDDARLAAVKQAAGSENWQLAAELLSAALAASPAPATEDRRGWLYQLGRLRELAGDPLGAAKAYDQAAAEPWQLADHARFAAAQLLSRAGQHDAALTRARAVAPGLGIAPDLDLVMAESLAAKGDLEGAAQRWRAWLGRDKKGLQATTVALAFARALLARPGEAHAEEAVQLCERVLSESPGGAGADDARKLRDQALLTLPFPRRKRFESPAAEELVARARGLVGAGQHREAIKLTDGLVGNAVAAPLPPKVACEAASVRADALLKMRRRPEATDAWGVAATRCQGQDELRAAALYNGGRAAMQADRVPEAINRYAELEKDFPKSNLADDARLKGARAALETGDTAKHQRMLTSMPDDYPDGDMVGDGLFELALSRIEKGDWAGAIAPLERGAARPRERAYHAAGRFGYYLGRARMQTGAAPRGVEDLVSVVRSYPLTFYMALANARLLEHDAALATRTLEEALEREPPGDALPQHSKAFTEPAFLRAVELARQGEAKLARAELDLLGLRARTAPPELLWASALLLSRAGSAQDSHGILRSATGNPTAGRIELTEWTEHYPVGRWRAEWEVAYPRPFAPIVAREAQKNGLSEALVYAIMREESAFDARVVSPANAFGLMQLVPTARTMARPLGIAADSEALKRPETNVTLGCRFLAQLRNQFPDNPLMAIPGYNAGGGAPRKWITERPTQDYDLWVERIPYEETRFYTKRVLGSMAAYELLYAAGQPREALRTPRHASPSARSAVASP